MLSTSHPSFKKDLKASRIARGLSGAELSRRIKISSGMMARYESTTRTDKVLPNPETLQKINEVLFPMDVQTGSSPIGKNHEDAAGTLPLDVLITELKKRGAKDIVF